MSSAPLDYTVTRARPEDRRFVAAAWTSSFVDSAWGRSQPSRHRAITVQSAVVDAILDAPGTRVYVITDPDSLSPWAGGFLVREGDVLHYAYVRPNFRRAGLFNSLWLAAAADGPLTTASHVRLPWSSYIVRKHGLSEDTTRT